jgi:hypothetical protein
MEFKWRCQKCFRYLSSIETESLKNSLTQRTVCPNCKSENKMTLEIETVILSCSFSKKRESNIHRTLLKKAPDTQGYLVDNCKGESKVTY